MNKIYKCKICGKEFDTFSALGGHTSAKHNTLQRENANKTKASKRIRVKKICPRCKRSFDVFRSLVNGKEYIPVKENSFCGRNCSNGRPQTEEAKLKISKAVTGIEPWNKGERHPWKNKNCRICGNNLGPVSSRPIKNLYCKKCWEIKGLVRSQRVSEAVKKAYANGKKVYGGTTKWLPYKNIKVQGSYEYRTCVILDKMVETGTIKNWEYTKDRISYVGLDNKEHNYLLDFKVINKDNSFYYIEVKGYEKERDKLKWAAVRDEGYELHVWFKKEIIEKEKEFGSNNRKYIQSNFLSTR
jgi:hypothetical protein